MLERPSGGERALLVHLHFRTRVARDIFAVQEFRELVTSAQVGIAKLIEVQKQKPDPRTFIGQGKVAEIKALMEAENLDLVIFNHELTPAQERNLEQDLSCLVLDRTTLILDIFAQRARSFEGKLQVELAQLEHLSTRLVRGWTHLERQKGGIGLRGPGETQLETDRRLLKNRVSFIKKRLERVSLQRAQNRQARLKSEMPTISLVGYTNAGKSTLFNALTSAKVFTADQLFATLDPTLRGIDLNVLGRVMLSDTVGFIRNLPHELIDAFKSTLEETRNANLLLQVIDLQDDQWQEHLAHVNDILAQIGAGEIPKIEVYNKIDLLPHGPPEMAAPNPHEPKRVWVSAAEGLGLDSLRRAMIESLSLDIKQGCLSLRPEQAHIRAQLFAWGGVAAEQIDEQGHWSIHMALTSAKWQQLLHLDNSLESQLT